MANTDNSEALELNNADSLQTARAYAGLIGEIPSSFTSTLRTLILDEEKSGGKLSSSGRFLALRLLKGPSLLASFYFAGLTYRQTKLAELGPVTPQTLIKVFTPYEIAGLIGAIYLYRKIRALVPESSWADISQLVRPTMEMGGHLGTSLPRIGFTIGLYSGGLAPLSLALFQKHDEKTYKEYRRHLRSSKLSEDLQFEMRTWGCTRYNIGSIFIQTLGFGVTTANAYSAGMSCAHPLGEGLSSEAYRFKIASIWLASLLGSGKVPEITHKGEYYPTQTASSVLTQEATYIREKGSKHSFLDRVKDDISPESNPGLFGAATAPAPQGEPEVSAEVASLIKDEDLG